MSDAAFDCSSCLRLDEEGLHIEMCLVSFFRQKEEQFMRNVLRVGGSHALFAFALYCGHLHLPPARKGNTSAC